MIKYYWRQFFHYWHNLRFRLKIEIFFLLLIVFTFFTSKLDKLFTQVLLQSGPTSLGLTGLLQHASMILLILPVPFIFYNLLPKQQGLKLISVQPLQRGSALIVIMIHVLKYQLLTLIIIIPVLIALYVSIGYNMTIYSIVFIFSWLLFPVVLMHYLLTKNRSRLAVYLNYYLFFLLYFICAGLTYWYSDFFLYFTIVFLFAGWLATIFWWPRHWSNWDGILNRLRPQLKKSRHQLFGWTYFNFPVILPDKLLIHIKRDTLAYLRNKNYVRLKVFGLSAFLSLIILIHIFYPQYYQIAIPVLSILFIWAHYAHQFNEKYTIADKKVFIRIQQITYWNVALARFISELFFVILMLLLLFISLIIQGISWLEVITLLGVIGLFAVFVLYTITVIRLLFYDRPRFAGYAYHFMIIFALLMSYQFYLVGPLITIFILIYMNLLSYRQFVK